MKRIVRRVKWHSPGFTLTEMMISLLVAAVIVTPFYIVTSGVSERTTRQQMETEAIQRSRSGLNTLITDLSRTGLLVSPNHAVDPRSLCRNMASTTALNRRAVVHLNPADEDGANDEILLTGNFIGNGSYPALVNNNVFMISAITEASECLNQFDEAYAYAHVVIPSGQHFDAKVEEVVYSDSDLCEVTVDASEMPGQGITSGDLVYVAANQSVVYRVETLFEQVGAFQLQVRELVRYFADFGATGPGACPLSDDIIVVPSRQIVAKYVEDFQVWFRPVSVAASNTVPNYYTIAALGSTRELTSDVIDGVAGINHVFPVVADLANPVDSLELGCGNIPRYGPEHVRSAVVRLAVRSETTDRFAEYPAYDIDTDPTSGISRLVQRNLRPYPAASTVPERPGALYKIRTLVTEVAMPNLAARSPI